MGYLYPFVAILIMSLLKMQISTEYGVDYMVLAVSVGLATIGVCVFGAVASVAALFILYLFYLLEEKKMKKLIALLLALVMVASMLVGCETNSTNKDSGKIPIETVETTDDETTNGDETTDSNETTDCDDTEEGGFTNTPDTKREKIDASKITSSTMFSEGKAWVRYGKITSEEYTTLYCINKQGEILFTISDTFLNSPSPFYNGLSIVPIMIDGEGVYCICDENGNITKPSDVGAREFLINPEFTDKCMYELFKDGYIFAKKVESSFSGSSVTAAIFNSSLEIVAGYSEEILAVYNQYSRYGRDECYEGYLFDLDQYTVFDVREAKEFDTGEFLSSFEPKYASDMWDYDSKSCVYYDVVSNAITIDLSQYSNTIYGMYAFENGFAPIVFDSGYGRFFSVIKEDGSFCFEPVELSGHGFSVSSYDGKYMLATVKGMNMLIEVFDVNGKIAEAVVEAEGTSTTVRFYDDVIYIQGTSTILKNCYYSLNLEPLF